MRKLVKLINSKQWLIIWAWFLCSGLILIDVITPPKQNLINLLQLLPISLFCSGVFLLCSKEKS